jgi:hypothetical protein
VVVHAYLVELRKTSVHEYADRRREGIMGMAPARGGGVKRLRRLEDPRQRQTAATMDPGTPIDAALFSKPARSRLSGLGITDNLTISQALRGGPVVSRACRVMRWRSPIFTDLNSPEATGRERSRPRRKSAGDFTDGGGTHSGCSARVPIVGNRVTARGARLRGPASTFMAAGGSRATRHSRLGRLR